MKPRLGPEVAQSNQNIRKLMRLAKASRGDVFYDLGCGRAQLCIMAVTEFNVKRAVGIESHKGRWEKAQARVKRLGLSRRIRIIEKDIYESDLRRATIVYNGLMEHQGDVEFYENNLKPRCALVTLSLPLVGVLPNSQDYPFYLMKIPFKRTRKESEWINVSLSRRATAEEFLTEIREDPDFTQDIVSLKLLMKKRFDQ